MGNHFAYSICTQKHQSSNKDPIREQNFWKYTCFIANIWFVNIVRNIFSPIQKYHSWVLTHSRKQKEWNAWVDIHGKSRLHSWSFYKHRSKVVFHTFHDVWTIYCPWLPCTLLQQPQVLKKAIRYNQTTLSSLVWTNSCELLGSESWPRSTKLDFLDFFRRCIWRE